jgi:hypothetical protein
MNFIPNTANQPHAAICVGAFVLLGNYLISFLTPSISDINLTKFSLQNSMNRIKDDYKELQSLNQINKYRQAAFLIYFVKSWQKFSLLGRFL